MLKELAKYNTLREEHTYRLYEKNSSKYSENAFSDHRKKKSSKGYVYHVERGFKEISDL